MDARMRCPTVRPGRQNWHLAGIASPAKCQFPRMSGETGARTYSASTTKSMHAVSASTSAGSIAGYIAIRSWLRPSLR